MRNNIDPVDRALESLRGREWPEVKLDPELENKLMHRFDNRNTTAFLSRHRVLVSALALMLVVGVSFAAAGGVALVRSWFVTVTVDGQTETHEVAPNEDGSATVTVPLPESKDGLRVVEMTVDSGELPAGDGSQSMSVSVSTDGDEAEVTITPEDDDGGE